FDATRDHDPLVVPPPVVGVRPHPVIGPITRRIGIHHAGPHAVIVPIAPRVRRRAVVVPGILPVRPGRRGRAECQPGGEHRPDHHPATVHRLPPLRSTPRITPEPSWLTRR